VTRNQNCASRASGQSGSKARISAKSWVASAGQVTVGLELGALKQGKKLVDHLH